MLYPILTYSRNNNDFHYDLTELHQLGLRAIRLIYKGKTEDQFNQRIKEIQQKTGENKLDILIDLPGRKPFVGDLGNGLKVEAGLEYQLVDCNSAFPFPVIPTVNFFDHEQFPNLSAGDIISIADDELNLLVKEVKEDALVCEALNSFHLTSNRSMGLKNKPFGMTANSEADLLFVTNMKNISNNVKLLVSFAKSADDILRLKKLQPEIEVIPKIETPINESDLLELIKHCKTVMLGRGDLSLVCSPKELFQFQKHLIQLCKEHSKKLIIGTGLLSGITEHQSPAIAEVTDYGYLRNEGIDAFLIAGSNAHYFPFETLKFMRDFEL